MKFYEITYIIDDEQQERLSALTERYEKVKTEGINGNEDNDGYGKMY